MINPSEIDFSSLPSVDFKERSKLPEDPCIYFAIAPDGNIQYIGKSVNPRQRWISHHRHDDVSKIPGIRIAYLECDRDLLDEVEKALIDWFKPSLNKGYGGGRQKREAPTVRIYATLPQGIATSLQAWASIDGFDTSELAAWLIIKSVEQAREKGILKQPTETDTPDQ